MVRDRNNGNRTFRKTTNEEIYQEIQSMRTLLETTIAQNCAEHKEIRGKLNLVRYIAIGAGAVAATVGGWFVFYLMK